MSAMMMSLLMQVIGGAVGGNGAGAALKNFSLGTVGNTIVGAVSGGVGGQALAMMLPMLSGGNADLGAMAGSLVGGGVIGAAVTAIVGATRNAMNAKA